MSSSYSKFAGLFGILAGICGLVYLVSFLVLKNPAALLPSLALLLLGVFASATLVGLYGRVREVDEGFALWGLLLGIGGAGGAAIHAAFDLNNNLHPPTAPFDYASPVDPRGFLTFAVAGLAALVISWLLLRGNILSRGVAYLGILSGVLLIVLYLAYLIILNATNQIVNVLILASGVAQPVWYLWIGWLLWQGVLITPPKAAARRR
jgi:hypothetical protein